MDANCFSICVRALFPTRILYHLVILSFRELHFFDLIDTHTGYCTAASMELVEKVASSRLTISERLPVY